MMIMENRSYSSIVLNRLRILLNVKSAHFLSISHRMFYNNLDSPLVEKYKLYTLSNLQYMEQYLFAMGMHYLQDFGTF